LGEINETVHQFDVNALFPSVMSGNLFPVSLDRYLLDTDYRDIRPGELEDCQMAEVEICTNSASVPFRNEKGVCYPNGKYRTTLIGRELQLASNRGDIKAVRATASYRLAPIFDEWVQGLWKMRQEYKSEQNELYERFTKTLMNSLYGKFGQRSPEWINCNGKLNALPWMTWVEYDGITKERIVYRSFGSQVQRQQCREDRHHAEMQVNDWDLHAERYGQGEIDTSFVAISAFVTSYARVRMDELRAIAGAENVYYQGVDSLIVTNSGRSRLENSGQVSELELGKLRLQLSANYGYINGCSDYRIGEKIVIAGLPRKTTALEQTQNLQRTFAAKPYMFQGVPSDYVMEQLTAWRKSAEYWKGTVSEDGRVEPLVLS
jgi:hypothetical protein